MAVSETVIGWGTLLAVGSVTAAVVVNGVLGNYEDGKGQAYGTASNVASVSSAGVAAAMVEPKQGAVDQKSDGATHGSIATRTFVITNDSNISDSYVISALTLSAGRLASVTFKPAGAAAIPATVGSTVSPVVAPGGSLTVSVGVATAQAPIGTAIEVALSAKTTAKSQNGSQTDTGKAWVWVARGPQIAGLPRPGVAAGPAGYPVEELVNGLPLTQTPPGGVLTFTIPFTNIGDAPAFGVTVTAPLPPQLRPIPGSVKLTTSDHRTGKSVAAAESRGALSGKTVAASIEQLDPGVDVALTFSATTDGSALVGVAVTNPVSIAALGLPTISASSATVFVGAMNVVYDGLGGAAHPVGGAVVSVVDPVSGQKIRLSGSGAPPNATNVDPFSTTPTGSFGFGLPPSTAGAAAYELDVVAAGYLNRRLKVAVEQSGGSSHATITAADGQPLATAGGYGLTTAPVSVSGVAGFFGNVPLFAPQALRLSLSTDRSVASPGDRLGYSITFGPGSKPVAGSGEVAVDLPAGVAYARGSAHFGAGAAASEPTVTGRTIAWPLSDISATRTFTFDAVLLPGSTPGAVLKTRARLSANVSGAPLTTDANTNVTVVGGTLGARSILSGRVFTDRVHDGRFTPGDAGVAAVRIFLEDGESVLTDADGRFSFPAARAGMHVLHLDPMTLPAGLHAYHGFPVTDPRSTLRLVHGVFDSGLMADVNFAVADGPEH